MQVTHWLAGDKLLLHCDIGLSKQDFTQDILHQLSVPDDASHISLYGKYDIILYFC